MSDIFVGDIGLVVGVTVTDDKGAVDLTEVAGVDSHFLRPDGSTFDKTMIVTDAAAGKCTATMAAGDLSISGMYQFQTTVTFSNQSKFAGEIKRFPVKDKL